MRHEKGGKGRGGPPEHSATADTSPSGGGGTGQRPGVRGAETGAVGVGAPGWRSLPVTDGRRHAKASKLAEVGLHWHHGLGIVAPTKTDTVAS